MCFRRVVCLEMCLEFSRISTFSETEYVERCKKEVSTQVLERAVSRSGTALFVWRKYGRYSDQGVHNRSRFISIMKNPLPLMWRNSHPCCLADHFLDTIPRTSVKKDPK